MSDRSPAGSLPAGTRAVELSLSTDRPSTCRWDTIEGVQYLEMGHAFERTGSTTHATPVTGLEDGRSYRYFVKCEAPPDCATPHDLIYSFTIGH